ncbi:Hypothetical protein PBC10988_11400 [Planctomycetales bacterium 10988]|nr:Hypothetical protein PBC10988_11400 [Planctomycetales bacterium 10988]
MGLLGKRIQNWLSQNSSQSRQGERSGWGREEMTLNIESLEERCMLADGTIVMDTATPMTPASQTVKVFSRWDSAWFVSSGAFINNYQVLTSAHSIFDANLGGYADEAYVLPGFNGLMNRDGESRAPFGFFQAESLAVQPEYAALPGNEPFLNTVPFDLGIISLDRPVGNITGNFFYDDPLPPDYFQNNPMEPISFNGYPAEGNFDGTVQYTHTGTALQSNPGTPEFVFTRDGNQNGFVVTYEGESGSPLYIDDAGTLTLVAALSGGTGADSYWTRLDAQFDVFFDNLSGVVVPPSDLPDLVNYDWYFDDLNWLWFDNTSSFSSTISTSFLQSGNNFQVSNQVYNTGTADAVGVEIAYYLSLDPNVTTSDFFIGSTTVNVDALDSTRAFMNTTIPAAIPDGTYYVGWIIDPNNNTAEYDFGGSEADQDIYPFTVTLTSSQIDDAYEENDTLATAYDLRGFENTFLSNIAGPGLQYDNDWYRISVTPNNLQIQITATFSHAFGDIDIALYDANGSVIVSSLGTTDTEFINYTVPTAGDYYIRVFFGNNGNPYDLIWDGVSSIPNNVPPVAVPDVFLVNLIGNSASSDTVLSNDTDANGDNLQAVLTDTPDFGSVVLNSDGTFTYTPNATFWGYDTFSYYATDTGSNSVPVTVELITKEAIQIRDLYQRVLSRDPDMNGWRYWTAQWSSGRIQLGDLASGFFLSQELLDPKIQEFYYTYLGRGPDERTLRYWRGVWQSTGSPDQVIVGIVASQEFYLNAGGTNELWVRDVYRKLLERESDPTGEAFWSSILNAGVTTKANVVYGFTRSYEKYGLLVDGWFGQYLSRLPSAMERDLYINMMFSGASQGEIQKQIINLPEYAAQVPTTPPGVATRTN